MRQIIFRGKRVDNGEWVYGYYVFQRKRRGAYGQTITNLYFDRHLIVTNCGESYEVFPETIGQYTGLTDENGKKIFEGDIMRLCSGTYPCLVYWDGVSWAWLMNGKHRAIDLTREKMSIIGNIHDNPELLEEEK